jgi:RNA polymerase sigma-70 factor, ECF subfamily
MLALVTTACAGRQKAKTFPDDCVTKAQDAAKHKHGSGVRDRNDDWSTWLRAGIAGDEAAYGRFLREVTPHLRAIARSGLSRAGRSGAEAEDIVQDALIAIHTKRTSWIPTEPVVPWLRAILKHKLIDSLRKRGSHGHIDIDEFAEAIPAPSNEPEIATRDVMKLAASLPSGQKAVIEAMFVDGHNTAETAAALSMSEGAVRVALHRALGGLAKMLRGSV